MMSNVVAFPGLLMADLDRFLDRCGWDFASTDEVAALTPADFVDVAVWRAKAEGETLPQAMDRLYDRLVEEKGK